MTSKHSNLPGLVSWSNRNHVDLALALGRLGPFHRRSTAHTRALAVPQHIRRLTLPGPSPEPRLHFSQRTPPLHVHSADPPSTSVPSVRPATRRRRPTNADLFLGRPAGDDTSDQRCRAWCIRPRVSPGTAAPPLWGARTLATCGSSPLSAAHQSARVACVRGGEVRCARPRRAVCLGSRTPVGSKRPVPTPDPRPPCRRRRPTRLPWTTCAVTSSPSPTVRVRGSTTPTRAPRCASGRGHLPDRRAQSRRPIHARRADEEGRDLPDFLGRRARLPPPRLRR